jgi:hypothetical protein
MKNEIIEAKCSEEKVGLIATTLPWWAKVLIAQHSRRAFPTNDSHYCHHCSDCGRILISAKSAYQYSNLCPECTQSVQSSKGGD